MNHDLPFFSVIVPTYERPEQLRKCLASLAQLDYPAERFEVIVVDDGSETLPVEIVSAARDAINARLLVQENVGPAAARNRAAADARGAFLAFTDDDCTVDAGWLRAFAARLKQTPQSLLGGRTLNALDTNRCSATSQMIIDVVYEHYNANPDDARFFASNNFAVAADLFRSVGGFNENFRTSEDREFCDRWRARGLRLSYAPAAVIHHAHPLTARSLWKQHFAYGRGAWRFHQIREARGAESFKPDMTFYLKLLRASCAQASWSDAALMSALLLWSQMANTAGFFYERIKRKRRLPTTDFSEPVATATVPRRNKIGIRYSQPATAKVVESLPKVQK